MTRSRVPETDQGIQGQLTVELYDQMQRRLRDKGWIETGDIIKSGITHGLALEDRTWPWLPGTRMAEKHSRYFPERT